MIRPTLLTERLMLRPFAIADAVEVQRLAGDRDIASTTLRIPHPYPKGEAEAWIASHARDFQEKKNLQLAILLAEGAPLIGAIGLGITEEARRGEIGYWIGKAYWGKGYGTEAAQEMLRYGFEVLGLNRIVAHHLARNPASGRVLEKLGMQREGYLRQHAQKWGRFEDVVIYGVLREEYRARQPGA